ncbi:hypothetical protein Cgig2_002715 [Carnegiea gigantea]|uniref:SWIM-type domain-containing protein n=1 Tax=Carnegiea gigantea TaxID=171969 RepID=A0A9Q1GLL6_9CARY|nr:hypothetical protein Cgig2_002715 [Carnegiea gigantea]
MGCTAAVECYILMLGEYSVELTNSHKLVVKLGQQSCTCRVWQTRGTPCCHALAVIAKANLWVYSYVHPIYKTATQQIIYNQLVHPMETHNIGIVDVKTGEDELDDDYDRCILTPTNGRQPEFSMFPAVRQPEMFTREEANVHRGKVWSATGKPGPILTVVHHSLQVVHCWETRTLQMSNCDVMHILPSQLSSHPHPYFCVNVEVQGAGRFTPICMLMIKYRFALVGGVRYSSMFTQDKANVHHGKPWCASGTPMGNGQIETVPLRLSDHTAFTAVSTPPTPICA